MGLLEKIHWERHSGEPWGNPVGCLVGWLLERK